MSGVGLRRTCLETLAATRDRRLGMGRHYLYPAIQDQSAEAVSQLQVMQMLWEMLAEGLLYVNYSQPAPENWAWELTERGRRAAANGEYEPSDPGGYLDRLRARIAGLDELVLLYAAEALQAYGAGCYLASSVMIGVASERAFQLVGEAFAKWLPETEEQKFRQTVDNPSRTYSAKFGEFRKRLEPHKPQLPADFGENMALTLDSVLDLLRITRNEAGHPTGRRIEREDAYINLQMFARYLERMFELRGFLAGAARG